VKKEGKARQVAKGKIPVGEKWVDQYLNDNSIILWLVYWYVNNLKTTDE
jgi:hypothetical protein